MGRSIKRIYRELQTRCWSRKYGYILYSKYNDTIKWNRGS